MEKKSKETLEKWNQNPKNWKFGCLYFNPEDKRIFPPKRIPWMGWTVNFANKKSVIVFVIMMALIISVIIFIPHKKYHL
jgi:uncharacterized membrane protein